MPAASNPASAWTPVDESRAPDVSAWQPVPDEQPVDERNGIQKSLDSAYAPESPERWANEPAALRPILNFGRGATQGLVSPIAHPLQAVKSMIEPSGFEGVIPGGASNPLAPAVFNTVKGVYDDYKQNGLAHALGDIGGAFASGEALKSPFSDTALPEAMKSAGGKMIDNAVGLRKADIARGAQPGRAYLEGGGGPALSMRGIANQASEIAGNTGRELGQKYAEATANGATIPGERLARVLNAPIDKAMAIKEGPGGTGGTSAFQEYRDSLSPILQKTNLTPNEVFAAKKNIAANTRWNDPTQYDLNKVRQMNVGGIGGALTEAVPGTGRLNKVFQGTTNLANRAGERAGTGQMPLSQLRRAAAEVGLGAAAGHMAHNPYLAAIPLALDTIPAKTSIAKGLFVGGDAGRIVAPLAGVPGVARPFSPALKKQSDTDR